MLSCSANKKGSVVSGDILTDSAVSLEKRGRYSGRRVGVSNHWRRVSTALWSEMWSTCVDECRGMSEKKARKGW